MERWGGVLGLAGGHFTLAVQTPHQPNSLRTADIHFGSFNVLPYVQPDMLHHDISYTLIHRARKKGGQRVGAQRARRKLQVTRRRETLITERCIKQQDASIRQSSLRHSPCHGRLQHRDNILGP